MAKKRMVLAKEWLASAKSDFQYAKVGLRQKVVYPQVAFLSQQIAEKYLKGFLIANAIEPPMVHDLPGLLDKCVKIDKKLEELREPCKLLTGFYTEVRYPPDIPSYTKNEIREAFESAKIIKEVIEGSSVR